MTLTLGPVIGQIGGGSVEEIPVSMSGVGGTTNEPIVYPLATVDAGAGALIVVVGTFSGSGGTSGFTNIRPHLRIGGELTHTYPYQAFDSGPGGAVAVIVSGPVTVSILSRSTSPTTFSGTVYVARF